MIVLLVAASMMLGAGTAAAHERSSGASAAGAAAEAPPPGTAKRRGAQDEVEGGGGAKAPGAGKTGTKHKGKKTGFVGLPIPIANPTLQQGLALAAAVFYNLGEGSPASMTGVGALYTSTESWGYGLIEKVYTSHDRWRITAGAVRFKLNLRFFGSGAGDGPYLPFSLDGKAYGGQLLRSVGRNVYMGLGYVYLSNTVSFGSGSSPGETVGKLGLKQSVALLSLPFLWDTRDNPLNPRRGNFLSLSATFSGSATGSDVTYQQYRVGFSHFAHLNDHMVLAFRGTACDSQNRPPFYLLCTLGRGDGLRGFPVETYWSGSSAAAVAEWRWNFAGRWGVVAFGGTGATGSDISSLELGRLVPSFGAGIRFMMAKEYGVNIGIDYGRSNDRDAIYFRVGEAF